MNAEQLNKLRELAKAADPEIQQDRDYFKALEVFQKCANPQAVLELIALAERATQPAQDQVAAVRAVPEGYVIAPHYRGYAHLGLGQYLINHSRAGDDAELAISIATEAQKAGRVVGDLRDNEPGEQVMPEDIAVRIRFENVAGLDALQQQLRLLREVHFAAPSPQPELSGSIDTPDVIEALHNAVSALYFDDSSDYPVYFWNIIKALDPTLMGEMETDMEPAFRKTRAALAQRTSTPSQDDTNGLPGKKEESA